MWYVVLLLAAAIPSVEAETSTDKPKNEIMQWPDGDYAMLKPGSGCPVDVAEDWREGYRKEYGKGTYNYSTPLDLFGKFTEEYMKFFFCVHKSVKDNSLIPRHQTYWEPGRYCILQSGGMCPNGFKSGYAQMDDADDKVHLLENGGTLPDGNFANDTGLYFCCRDDGLVTKDIVLPKKNPFVLYMVTGETRCQTVRGMTSSIQYLQFNDDHSGNRGIANGTLPAIKIENNNTLLLLCHYKPIECEIMQWPDGDYAMLKPGSGCPVDVAEEWREGYRKEYGKGTYNYSTPLDLFGEFTEEYMKFFFCVHKSVKEKSLIPRYQTYWEPGRYCIIRSGGMCPNSFKSGYAQMDDADDKVHLLENGGTLPDGYFANDTGLYFCCRDDGLVTKDIVLPKKNPFVLYMVTGETRCQTVRGMTSSIQYLQFNDDHSGNRGIANGTLPAIKIENNNTMLLLCHYTPIECENTGCKDKDGEVIALNSVRTKNCVTKKCILENGFNVLKIISGGCSVESKCKTVGEEWSVLRAEGCVRQVCQMQMVNNTEKFLVKDIGQDCTWMDSCKAVNSTWKHGCITYRCDLSVGTDHYKLTVQPTEFATTCGETQVYIYSLKISSFNDVNVLDTTGNNGKSIASAGPEYALVKTGRCSDGDKCYSVGEKVARNCYEVVCKLSENKTTVYFDIVQEACEWKGQCKTVNEVWSEDCVAYICRVNRSENNVSHKVEPLKLGCKDSKNNCIAVGEQRTEGCITYKCVHHSLNIGLQVLAAGCDWRGVCKPENSTWTDDENCVDYRCNRLTLGGGTVVRTETVAYGCKWNSKCKPADAAWSEDCLRRKCVVVVNATHVQRQVMSTVEGCQTLGSSECHAVDSTWTETQNNSCTRLTCTRNGPAITTKVLERLCLDSVRTCHPVGASGFQAEIQGLVRINCSCLARDMDAGVMVRCPG